MRRNLTGNSEQKKVQRNRLLAETDWIVTRHRDEKDEGGGTTLTVKQFKAVLAYRKALRNWDRVTPLPVAPELP
jgi:hypothetical protein